MNTYFDYHAEAFLVTPLIGAECNKCATPECDAEHWMISLGWLVWTVNFVFEL